MGEEEKRKGGEKEKEKEKDKMGDGDKDNKKKDKKDESPPIIILKTDLHCEGCAMKVKRAIRSLPGVDTVYTDAGNNRVTVTGPADPWEVKERMEAKTKRNVEFVSPANPPKKDKDKVGGDKKPGADSPKQPKKDAAAAAEADDKKPKEPPESTVMLKIRLHCDGCIDRIKRRIYKVKGVKEVSVDAAKDLITVKGTMDVNSLPSYLTEKLRRSVEIVPAAKKDGGGSGGDKKEKEKEKETEKEKEKEKEKKDGGAGGDKMKEEKEEKAAADVPPPAADVPPSAADVPPPAAPSAAEVNRYDYYGYGYGYGYGYRVEIGHAPQIFSDENPNACMLM